MRVALFDFDGTLYPGQTFDVMLRFLKEHPKYNTHYRKFMSRFRMIYIAYKLKLVSKDNMRASAMQQYIYTFKENTRAEVLSYFKELASEIKKDLYVPLTDKAKRFKSEGIYTMVISGAYTELLEAIFGDTFDHLIGTEISYKDNYIDTKASLTHMQSEHKVTHIYEHLDGKEIDWENSYAFSDSITDLDMLNLVGNAYVIQPDEALLAHAQKQRWEIMTNE